MLLQVHHGRHSGRDEATERVSSGGAGVGVAAAGRYASLCNDELLLESMQQKSALPILKYLVETVIWALRAVHN